MVPNLRDYFSPKGLPQHPPQHSLEQLVRVNSAAQEYKPLVSVGQRAGSVQYCRGSPSAQGLYDTKIQVLTVWAVLKGTKQMRVQKTKYHASFHTWEKSLGSSLCSSPRGKTQLSVPHLTIFTWTAS